MNILITGGTGFLGAHLCRRLAEDGHAVTVFRRASSSTDKLANVHVAQEIGDIRDANSLRRAAKGQHVIIHAAAGRTGVGSRERSYEINVEGTRNVVNACLANGVHRLLHVSSVAAVGIPEDVTPANEDFRFNLEGSKLFYHISKFRAEGVIAEGVGRGLDAVIVNPSALWGPSGSSYNQLELVRSIRHAQTLRCSPGGVCIVHVEDVVDGIIAAISCGVTGSRYILGGDNLTFREWMQKMATALGIAPRLVSVPRIITDSMALMLKPLAGFSPGVYGPYLRAYLASRSTFYDSRKAARILGYRPRSFEAILEEAVRFL